MGCPELCNKGPTESPRPPVGQHVERGWGTRLDFIVKGKREEERGREGARWA